MSKNTADKAIPKTAPKVKAMPRARVRAAAKGRAGNPALAPRTQAVARRPALQKPAPQKTVTRGVEGNEQLDRLGKDGLQVYARTGSIMVKGFEDLSREIALYAQATLEVNVAAAKAMTEAKSLDEVLDLQSKAARESFDIMLSEGAKLTELSFDLANKSIAPIQAQVDKTVATLLKRPAA